MVSILAARHLLGQALASGEVSLMGYDYAGRAERWSEAQVEVD